MKNVSLQSAGRLCEAPQLLLLTASGPSNALQGTWASAVGNGQRESIRAPAGLTPQGKLLLRGYPNPWHFHTDFQSGFALQGALTASS